MKRYVGRRELISEERWRSRYGHSPESAREMALLGQTEFNVYVQELDDGEVVAENPLFHHVHHSPDGFEAGYAGSGPAETARCILIDHFGGLDQLPRNAFGEPVVPFYQRFKEQFIATAPKEGFVIDDVEVSAWLVLAAEASRAHAES